MELLPTLRAQLDGLTPYLEDDNVFEILIAAPDRVFVTRATGSEVVDVRFDPRTLRTTADRLLRALGGRPDRHDVRTGRLTDRLMLTVVGAPRQERSPVLRVHHRARAEGALEGLAQAGLLLREMQDRLHHEVEARRSVILAAPFGAPRERVLAALAKDWRATGRVLAVDTPGGPLDASDAADLTVPPETPVDGLLAAAPDVVVCMDPTPGLWSGLLHAGRPVLAALEAPDGPAALERLIALALAGQARLSRPAAEALVASTLGAVLELGPGRELWIRRLLRPERAGGELVLASELEQPAPAPRAIEAPPEPAPVPDGEVVDETAVGPDDTSAFAAAALVEELSNEIAEAEAAMRAADSDSAASAPSLGRSDAPPRYVSESAGFAPEEQTRFATGPEAEALARGSAEMGSRRASEPVENPEPDSPFDTNPLPPRRQASERMATVTGPPRPSEVANQIENVLDELASDPPAPAEEDERPPVEPDLELDLEEDLRTSHAVAPPDLDPFETHDVLAPGPMDSTQAAEIAEMLAGEVNIDPRVLAVPPQPTVAKAHLPPPPSDDEWDEEAPSELIDRAEVAGLARGASEGEPASEEPFEDEKTPVAPLFEQQPARGSRRPRRRPRSTTEERDSPADDIGDPTRRRKDPPERPRGGRRRQRDRS